MPMNRGRQWRLGENGIFANVPYNTPLGRAGLNYSFRPAGYLPSENPNLQGIRDTSDALLAANGIEVGDQKLGTILADAPIVGKPSMGLVVMGVITVGAIVVFLGTLLAKPRQ